MPGAYLKYRTFFLVATASCCAALSFCGNNPYHAVHAASVLKMAECLECHSGAPAKSVTICLGNECLYSKSHSIMRPYPPSGKREEYAATSDIEKAGCVLEDGKTTCLSCHDLTKPPPHLIVEGDQLCSICHLYYSSGRK